MGPRSDERGNPSKEKCRSAETAASMGPRSDERGNARNATAKQRRMEASMGPRSDERGNEANQISHAWNLKLQWGRARMSAEICASSAKSSDRLGFNGAALG